MITIATNYVIITTILTLILVLYLFKRLFSPYRCACGRTIWTGHGILRHLSTKHAYIDPRK